MDGISAIDDTPMVKLCKTCKHWDTTLGWHEGIGTNPMCECCVNGPYTSDNFIPKEENND